MLKSTLLAATITALMLSTAAAQSSPAGDRMRLAQNTQSNSDKDNSRDATLADAASINEDLIGFALDAKADRVAEKVVEMRKALYNLRPLLNERLFETVGHQVADMERASAKEDLLGTALAAVETFRVIENAKGDANRPEPVEVALLDYSGFKLSILLAAHAVDWATVDSTAKESDTTWMALAKNIQEISIRNLVGTIQNGLRAAVARKDINGAKFAAKMQLEVVDTLEDYFKRVKERR